MSDNQAESAQATAVAKATDVPHKPLAMPRIYNNIVLSMENVLITAEKLENTPSRLDELDEETEKDLRILGCELIQTSGILLKLPQVAMATGQILFQRFYYTKSFVRYDMETVAMSCVCLASKIEEEPRRIRDVINVFTHIKQVRLQRDIVPVLLDDKYINLKAQVIKAERRVLKELGFCVHVKHPHKLIVMYLQLLGFEKQRNMMQMSWNYMNDSLRTDVFMRYNPETIACACIFLSARKLGIPLPEKPYWFAIFKVQAEDLVDTSFRVLELYTRPKLNALKLQAKVDLLKKRHADARELSKVAAQAAPVAAAATEDTKQTAVAPATHNDWGGFVQRTLPLQDVTKPSEKPTKTPNTTPPQAVAGGSQTRGRKRTRSRSHSHSRSYAASEAKRSNNKRAEAHHRKREPSSEHERRGKYEHRARDEHKRRPSNDYKHNERHSDAGGRDKHSYKRSRSAERNHGYSRDHYKKRTSPRDENRSHHRYDAVANKHYREDKYSSYESSKSSRIRSNEQKRNYDRDYEQRSRNYR